MTSASSSSRSIAEASPSSSKTGSGALIPLYGELKALLKEIPKVSPIVLTNSDDHP